ncbi:MAG: TRAP transporter large permease [Brevinema sp.]
MGIFESLLLIFFCFLLIIIRVPIAIAMGTSLFFAYIGLNIDVIDLALDIYQSINSFPLLAIPMFILAGNLMATGGVAYRILDVMDEFMGRMYGGLAIVTIFSCILFGGLSGSAPATVAAIGSIMIPEMIKRGYSASFAAGITACAGVIAIIIPPSNPMIIYALAQRGTSISTMFLSGVIPGVLLALSMAIPAYVVARKNGWRGDTDKVRTWETLFTSLLEAKWALFTPVIILGGIYSGIFTPTESAAVACLYAYFVGVVIHKDLHIKDTMKVLIDSANITVVAMFLIPFAVALGKLLTSQQIPQMLTQFMSSYMNNYTSAMLLIIVLLLFVGTFMDTLASIIILTPLLYPIVQQYNISVYHFGIILIMGLGIGFITPPLGGNLFIANQISKTSIQQVFIESIPMLIGMIFCVLLIAFIPAISNIFV